MECNQLRELRSIRLAQSTLETVLGTSTYGMPFRKCLYHRCSPTV